MKLISSVILVSCLILSTGCQKKASEEIDAGTFTGPVYHNNYFGIRLTLPPDWKIQDKKAMETLKNAGKKMIEGSNKKLKAALDFSDYQTVHLFAAFKHPLFAQVTFNPNVMGIAERVGHVAGIKSGKDYLLQSKQVMKSSNMNMKFPQKIYSEAFGGVEFAVLCTEMTLMGRLIKQKQYSLVKKGYALTFNISFISEDQEAELKKILNTMTFD